MTRRHMPAYAHTKKGALPPEWHHLDQHLSRTAELAGAFAARFDGQQWGDLAGRWHDLGKHSEEFQAYLRVAGGADDAPPETAIRTDHKSAGAQHAVESAPTLGHLLAYAIAGHHGGMPDGISAGSCLEKILAQDIPAWKLGQHSPPGPCDVVPSPHLGRALGEHNAYASSFFTRMIFSCLVDADFLDTERFMDPQRSKSRHEWQDNLLPRMEEALDSFISRMGSKGATIVGDRRNDVRDACLVAASKEPGFFSLTVPTGGGKTLSSLAFALRHAILFGLDRVIYVAPFTSIIEQNASVFRDAMSEVSASLGQDVVLEHHSNIDVDEHETVAGRLATENWDAPLIVTTSVQFYESLFHNKSSRCRKIHRIARSVVILDEVQTLPVQLLDPCLRALTELVHGYRTTIVLCTATQPALHFRPGFDIGLKDVREVIPNPTALSSDLKRVHVENLGETSDEDLVSRMLQEDQVLCIVNTRAHARDLYEAIGADEANYHLSALMIPRHRSRVIQKIRERLDLGRPCRLIATQLIEAGVDIDFPVVYRSMAGLDSIAQAAGRCNRNGRILKGGRTFVFDSLRTHAERFLMETQAAARQAMHLHEDPLSLEAMECYFKLYYWDQSAHWDKQEILQHFHLDGHNPSFPFLFDFATCAKAFHLIEETGRPVIVPWEEEGYRLCERLRHTGPLPPRDILRRLQRYTVQIPMYLWEQSLDRGIDLLHGRYAILTSPDVYYLDATGLDLDNPVVGPLVV